MDNQLEYLRGIKISFVFGNLELGGAERQGVLLANYLQQECGAEVNVVGLHSSPGRLSELCDEHNIRWSGIPFHWGARRRIPSFLRALRHLKELGPEILISYTRVPNLVCAVGWSRVGAKVCIWNQSDEGLLMKRLPHYRYAVRQPHCFISNSTGGKKFLVNAYGKLQDDIHVIYNGIALTTPALDKTTWRRKLEVPAEAPVACMVANLTPYKDHPTLLRAWKEVIEHGSFTAPPVLVLGGRFDGQEKDLWQLAEQLGIADFVRMPGKIDDVSGLLAAVDLFTFSSKSEGIPNAVLEAMATGLPIVATDIPGLREAVGPVGSEYLCGVGDSTVMADRIIALLQNREHRAEVGKALKIRAEQEFSLEHMCRKSAEVICGALERARKA